MKNKIFISFLLLFFLLIPFVAGAKESIQDFSVRITINKDASIDVVESIVYDFDTGQKHGIYRSIPVRYKARGGNYKLGISNIVITDTNGDVIQSEIFSNSDNLEIKIGDPKKLITGQYEYVIAYKVKRAINYFEDHDELYWNVTGNGWEVGFENVKAVVVFPEEFSPSDLKLECYRGRYGEQSACGGYSFDSSVFGKILQYEFKDEGFALGEGMTVAVGLPKGILIEPSLWEKIGYFVADNWVVGLPLLTFLVMLYLWYTRGRDPKGRGTVIAQYEPPDNLTPSELGTMYDERVDMKDVSAEIINLAVQGYLKIHYQESKVLFFKSKDYILERLKSEDDLNSEHQRLLMHGLFHDEDKVKISDLKNKFYSDLSKISKQVYQNLVTKGYYLKSPNVTKIIYMVLGGIVGGGLSFFGNTVFGLGPVSIVSGFVSGIIIILFGFIMPSKTVKGAVIKEQIYGFKEYLKVAEQDRIRFHNAPEKKPELFERFLPYAMALGVEKMWAKQFEGIYNQRPDWYFGQAGTSFSAFYLAESLNSFSSQAKNYLGATAAKGGSGVGGGGFSGGGFGGGGGGSW